MKNNRALSLLPLFRAGLSNPSIYFLRESSFSFERIMGEREPGNIFL